MTNPSMAAASRGQRDAVTDHSRSYVGLSRVSNWRQVWISAASPPRSYYRV
ncbi:MAG: hypothetical protein ABW110_17265 [Steroidobacteraceae bacterium]